MILVVTLIFLLVILLWQISEAVYYSNPREVSVWLIVLIIINCMEIVGHG